MQHNHGASLDCVNHGLDYLKAETFEECHGMSKTGTVSPLGSETSWFRRKVSVVFEQGLSVGVGGAINPLDVLE